MTTASRRSAPPPPGTAPTLDRASDLDGPPGLIDRIAAPWLAPAAVGLRQLPGTVSILLTLVIVRTSVAPARPQLLVAATVLVVLAQVVGSTLPWERLPQQLRTTMPLAQMVAIGLLDVGAGLPRAEFDILLVVPVLTLALRRERWGPAVALLGCALVLLVPTVVDVQRNQPLLHAVVTFVIVAPTVVGAHGIVQVVRRQASALQHARDALDERAHQLSASRDMLSGIMQAATQQAIVATDADGVVLVANSGAARIFGRAADDVVGRSIGRLVTSDEAGLRLNRPDDDGAGVPLDRLVGHAADGGTHVEEWRSLLPDGTVRYLELIATRRPTLAGESPELPAGYLFVGTDVTHRHEEERQQDEFIGLVSHELRTPLASILGYLELIRSDDATLDDEQRRYLDVVERNATRLRSLVDELLASAQVVVGAATTAHEVDVVDVVRGAVASAAPISRAAGVRVDVAEDGRVPLRSDPQRLAQVVDNLLSNAVKHSLAGDHVVIETHRGAPTADGARTARIRVVDEGAGISPDELSHLTERFYRTRDTRRRRVRGVGLGLSLVQAIVDEHGGTLTIDSEPGVGTSVEVVLPDLPESAGPQEQEPAGTP